ncbi:MAG: BadF/BadG/BcrA/BcrD ATPase family protein, partial [Myxococcota bacterium]
MRYLGIDIGMMFVKVCIINKKEDIERKWYIRHYFEPIKALANIIEEVRSFEPESFNITGSASEILKRISNDIRPLDIIGSNIAFATHISGGIRHIIDIGAGSLSYVRLNERGEIENIATNSLCAAGTGSFVDEQLSRLGLNYDMVRQFKRIEDPPSIATRCAVFAKSDITHRQQEGYSKEESYSGLCKGLATTIFQTLIRGKMIEDDILILGGLTLNNEV